MKRSAKQELTKEILKTPKEEEQEKEATPDEIASRRIVKIKSSKNNIKKSESTQPNNQQKKSIGIQLIAPLIAPTGSNSQQQQQTNIFPQNQKLSAYLLSTGIFGNSGATGQIGGGGLFSNAPIAQNLFGNPSCGSGLFGSLQKSVPAEDEEDDEEGDDELLENKSQEGNPEKIKVNFEYQQDFEKIVNIEINKFRLNQQDPSLQGFISLEKLKNNRDQYIIVYRNATKLILHQGIVLNMTQFSNLNNREDCLQMSSYELVDIKEGENNKKQEKDQKENENNKEKKLEKKLLKNILKIMFKSKEDCTKFITALENAIDQLKKPQQ